MLNHFHPVLSCQKAREHEATILSDEESQWSAMKRAGQGVARQLLVDYSELRVVPERLRVLALIGKGSNAGDTLIACGQLLADFPRAQVDLILTCKVDKFSPLAFRAMEQLEGRVYTHQVTEKHTISNITSILDEISDESSFHICLDGLVGMSFSPPMRQPLAALIKAVNSFDDIDLRASVDLPSGRGDLNGEGNFLADFTYATGIAKKPLFTGSADCGRIRYLDLGFFDGSEAKPLVDQECILMDSVLDPIRRLRPADVDKRKFGHLYIIGGSAEMPGALLMAVQAAVRSGVGLVTAFSPASVTAALAAQVPEAIWISWPEAQDGTLSPRFFSVFKRRIGRASALLLGPGMGQSRNTEHITQEIVEKVRCPIILDADSLRSRVVEILFKRRKSFGSMVVTPHMGEFMRMLKIKKVNNPDKTIMNFSSAYRVITVLKGPVTRICDGQSLIYSTQGGPVLSRGGNGDILAGLIGGMIAQKNTDVATATARGVMLHGLAAQELAREKGQITVKTTQILDYLPRVLRR